MTTLERLDQRKLTYRFDLAADVPWARAHEPGVYFPDALLERLGFSLTALARVPGARASLDVLLAIATADMFCALERDVIRFVESEGKRHPSRSAALLVSEEHKHIALFERLGRLLKDAHPVAATALARTFTAPPAFDRLLARSAELSSPDELAFSFWLHTLFFEEYTVFLQHALEHDARPPSPVQPLWLAAHHLHRQEELQHILTDAASLEALAVPPDAQRRLSKALWFFLDVNFGALFGLDACAAALAALFPSLTDVRAHAAPLHTLPVLQDVLTHAAFRRTRTAARFIGEMASTADPAPFAFSGLDGGPAAHTPAPDETLVTHLRKHAGTAHARITYVDLDGHEETASFAALAQQAEEHLAVLGAHGARPGDPIVLLTALPATTVPWFWACMLGGLVAVPLALPTTADDAEELRRLLRIVRQLKGPLLVVEDAAVAVVQQALASGGDGPHARVIGSSSRGTSASGAAFLHEGAPHDTALVQFSSGSLGDPRGVLLTHANILADATAMLRARGGPGPETFVSWMPLFHDMGLIGYHLTPLIAGAHQVLLSPLTFMKDPLSWLDALSRHKATVTGGPHFALARLLPVLTHDVVQRLDLSALDTFLVGAEPLSARVLHAFAGALAPAGLKPSAVCPAYGLAEATLAVTMAARGESFRAISVRRESLDGSMAVELMDEHAPEALAVVDCGAPIAGVRVRVVSDAGDVQPDGVVGSLHLAGPTVSGGYSAPSSAPSSALSRDEPLRPGDARGHDARVDAWIDTGDLGFVRDGRLFVCGRKKDVFFVGGRNFYANDVEAIARELPFLHPGAVALVVNWDASYGVDELVLFVALRTGTNASADGPVPALLAQVHAHVQRRMGISLGRVVQIDKRDVPRTTSGKLKRRGLLERLRAGGLDGAQSFSPGAAPSSSPGKTAAVANDDALLAVRAAWAAVLELPLAGVAAEASFRGLGGDSFKAVQVHDRLEKHWGVALPPEILVVGVTPRAMAVAVERALHDARARAPVPAARAPAPAPAAPTASSLAAAAKAGASDARGDIALVSLAVRAPGVDTPAALWRLLTEGRTSIGPLPASRRASVGEILDPTRLRGAWLEGFESFDPTPFSLSDAEATALGPAQRLVLECAFEALASAALPGKRIGVFVGAGDDGTAQRLADDPTLIGPHALLGALTNLIAARVSRTFGLSGPAFTVDSACSSSLLAVHLACQSLRAGECDAALAGGVQVGLSPALLVSFAQAGLLSARGEARPLDEAASGLVPGEAAGLVVLKRLEDAERDQDRILAVVRGSAVNNDGGALSGTAPSPDGQRDVIARAWSDARLPLADAAFFELHAAGTALGDAIEARALADVRGRGADLGAVPVGSLKGNLGHTLAAAGVLGLIKAALSLAHATAPATPGLSTPSSRADFPTSRLSPTCTAVALPPARAGRPLVAGVSSFGLGGTNVHVVLEGPRTPPVATGGPFVFVLGAPAGGMAASARAMRAQLANSSVPLAEAAAASGGFAQWLPERRAVLAHDRAALLAGLDDVAREPTPPHAHAGLVAFVLPGPGSQVPGMGAVLARTEPVFRAALERCAAITARHDVALLPLLFDADSTRIHALAAAQPAVFAYGYALAQLLQHRGVHPDVVIGHSAGELLAAHLAGLLSLDDALSIVIARGRVMADAAPGRMAAVLGARARVEELVQAVPAVSIAAHNAPEQVVVSGTEDAIADATALLEQDGLTVRRLDVDCAAHSSALVAARAGFSALLAGVDFAAAHAAGGRRPLLVSTTTAQVLSRVDAAHLLAHLTAPVDFLGAIRRARALGVGSFIELGATAGLSTCVRQICAAEPDDGLAAAPLVVACGVRGEPEQVALATAMAALVDAGLPVSTGTLGPRTDALATLPYPWKRRRLWRQGASRAARSAQPAGLLSLTAIRDHVTGGRSTAPAALLVDRALEALARERGACDLEEIFVARPLVASQDGGERGPGLHVDAEPQDPDRVRVFSVGVTGARTDHVLARACPPRGRTHARIDLAAVRARLRRSVTAADVYARLDATGFVMGPAMRSVQGVDVGAQELLAPLLTPPDSTRGAFVDPALLDGASHAVAAFFIGAAARTDDAGMYLGFSIEGLRVHQPVHDRCLAYVRLRAPWQRDAATLRYDIALVDDDGEVLCDVEDFAARRVEGSTRTHPPVAAPGVPSSAPADAFGSVTLIPAGVPLERAQDAAPGAPRAALVALLRLWVAERLRRRPDQIPEHAPLVRLGVDSLMAVELVRKLEAHLGVKLYATLLFEAPTLAAVTDRVLGILAERGVALPVDAQEPR